MYLTLSLIQRNSGVRMTSPRPPFRADQVGSLLRPERLLKARVDRQQGLIDAGELAGIEDECIREVARQQEAVGLHAITDGDFRRFMFHIDFLTSVEGIRQQAAPFQSKFHGTHKDDDYTPAIFETVGKLRHSRDIAVNDFNFLKSVTQRTPKVTLPSPTFAHYRGGRNAIDRDVYPDLSEFFTDLAKVYRAEISGLGAAGCRYIQLDEVHYAFFCDPKMVAALKARGDDSEILARQYTKLINDSVRERPKDMSLCVHLCRGNYRSSWVAQGGYEPIAEMLFNELQVDGFFLEYDTDRAGGFEPLRFVPPNKTVVLGLVTSKSNVMETADALRSRIADAAKFVPLEQLALSPQCGFASSIHGNDISMSNQWKKLEMIVRVAEDVWGSAR